MSDGLGQSRLVAGTTGMALHWMAGSVITMGLTGSGEITRGKYRIQKSAIDSRQVVLQRLHVADGTDSIAGGQRLHYPGKT
jgi:hypothetical protein